MIPQWFLYLQGFAMLAMGVALLALRQRPRGATLAVRFLNLGTAWALICCAAGVVLLAMALGWIDPPGLRSAPAPGHGTRARQRPVERTPPARR